MHRSVLQASPREPLLLFQMSCLLFQEVFQECRVHSPGEVPTVLPEPVFPPSEPDPSSVAAIADVNNCVNE